MHIFLNFLFIKMTDKRPKLKAVEVVVNDEIHKKR